MICHNDNWRQIFTKDFHKRIFIFRDPPCPLHHPIIHAKSFYCSKSACCPAHEQELILGTTLKHRIQRLPWEKPEQRGLSSLRGEKSRLGNGICCNRCQPASSHRPREERWKGCGRVWQSKVNTVGRGQLRLHTCVYRVAALRGPGRAVPRAQRPAGLLQWETALARGCNYSWEVLHIHYFPPREAGCLPQTLGC